MDDATWVAATKGEHGSNGQGTEPGQDKATVDHQLLKRSCENEE